jgi:tetratricopeptide (TPR) repeat protein
MRYELLLAMAGIALTFSGCTTDMTMQPAVVKLSERADALIKENKPEEALCRLEAASELAPESFQAQYNVGVTLNKLEQWERAVIPLKKAHEIKPESADILYTMGVNYQALGDAYVQAAKTAPNPPKPTDPTHSQPTSAPPTSGASKAGLKKARDAYTEAMKAYEHFLKIATEQDPSRADVNQQLEALKARMTHLESDIAAPAQSSTP